MSSRLILVGIVCRKIEPLLKLLTLSLVCLSRLTPVSSVAPLLVESLIIIGLSSSRSGILLQVVVSPLKSRCLRVVRPLTTYILLFCLVRTQAWKSLFIQWSGLGFLRRLKFTRLGALVGVDVLLALAGLVVVGLSFAAPGRGVGLYVVTWLRILGRLLVLGLTLSRVLSDVVWKCGIIGLEWLALLLDCRGSRRSMLGPRGVEGVIAA